MTITREDLVAAATVGLLQYRQVDPLLVFLLQRDVRARRVALAASGRASRRGTVLVWLSYVAGLLALLTATLFLLLFASHAARPLGAEAILASGVLYLLGAVRVVSWFKRNGYCARLRLFAALAMLSVPIALLVLQQAAV